MTAKLYYDIAYLKLDRPSKIDITDSNSENVIVTICDNNEIRKKYCFDKLLSEYGNSMYNYDNKSVFGYADLDTLKIDYPTTESGIVLHTNQAYLNAVNKATLYIESLITFLWLIKDNSVGLYGSYGQIPENNSVHGKSRSIVNYNCFGELNDTIFTGEEIKNAAALITKYASLSTLSRRIVDELNIIWCSDSNNNRIKGIPPKTHNAFNYSDQNALDRAIHFLSIARNQNYLLYRIAYYMPIFECFFGLSETNVLENITTNTAAYLTKDPDEKTAIIHDIDAGYNIRSRFIHGQALDKTVKKSLPELSKQLDNYLRQAFLKIITEDHNIFIKYNKKDRERYFRALKVGENFNHEEVMLNLINVEIQNRKREEHAAKKLLKQQQMAPKSIGNKR